MVKIPDFRANGRLPVGIHAASWVEFCERFAGSATRQHLLAGIRTVMLMLADAGCRTVYIDGSFVTAAQEPADWDGCWETRGVDLDRLNPALLDTSPGGIYNQKMWFRGELYPATSRARGQLTFLEFFQLSKEDDEGKGLVALDPTEAV